MRVALGSVPGESSRAWGEIMGTVEQKQMFPVFGETYDGATMREFANQLERFLKQSDFNFIDEKEIDAATYTVLRGDHILNVIYTATGAVTLTLPDPASANWFRFGKTRFLYVKDLGRNAAANNITLNPEGAALINGAATYAMNANGMGLILYSTGEAWEILAKF